MGCGNWLLWQLRKKWSQGEYRYVDVYLCVYWFSAVAYSSLWSTSCRNCDTIWVVATFLNQTICHCKTNSKILVFFLETTESIQKSADLSIQCEKPNVNILGTGCYLILHNRGRSTKWKKKSLLLPSESFPKLKTFQAVEDGKTEPLSEGAIVCLPCHCQDLGSSRIKSQKLKMLTDSMWYTSCCDSCWTSHVFTEGKPLFYKAFLGLSASFRCFWS